MKPISQSRYLTEESTGYAKLKSKRFRKIRYNEEEKAIMTDDENAAIVGVSIYAEENPDDENAYYNYFDNIRNPRAVDAGEFEVFYSFSANLRGARGYGNENWSARFLYEFLCAAFNSGERFIDTYFNRVFMSRTVYGNLTDIISDIREGIRERWNDGELRGGQWSSFYRFQEGEMSRLLSSLQKFSREIRQDIVNCLAMGMIPLNFSLAPATIAKRRSLGLGNQPFSATTWLINELSLHIILGESDTGMMYYSDSYKGAH